MRKISNKTYTFLNAKPGDVFVVPYKADIPKSTCARYGVKLRRTDNKVLDKSFVLVL